MDGRKLRTIRPGNFGLVLSGLFAGETRIPLFCRAHRRNTRAMLQEKAFSHGTLER
jgi:hypothetical protein